MDQPRVEPIINRFSAAGHVLLISLPVVINYTTFPLQRQLEAYLAFRIGAQAMSWIAFAVAVAIAGLLVYLVYRLFYRRVWLTPTGLVIERRDLFWSSRQMVAYTQIEQVKLWSDDAQERRVWPGNPGVVVETRAGERYKIAPLFSRRAAGKLAAELRNRRAEAA